MVFPPPNVYGVFDVTPRVSIHCCGSRAAAGRSPGRAGSEEAEAGLARLRLPARLSTAVEQQPASLCPERRVAAFGTPESSGVVHRPNPTLLRLGRRAALPRPARLLQRPLQWRHLWSVLDADAERPCLELRLIGLPTRASQTDGVDSAATNSENDRPATL